MSRRSGVEPDPQPTPEPTPEASLPTVGNFLFAALDLTDEAKAWVVELYRRLGQDPTGLDRALDAFLNSHMTPLAVARILAKVKSDLIRLAAEGHGPTSSDPVDLA